MGREITLLNREAFLELPKEWQDLVIKSAKTMLHDRLNKGYGTELAEAIRGSEAGGRVKFIDVSPADREKLAALGKKIQQEWMQQKGRSPEAKELYELILNFKKGWKEGG